MAFTTLLRQTVTRKPWTGQDGYNEATLGTSASLTVRVQPAYRMIRVQGEEKVSTATIFFDADPGLDLRDQLTLADGTTPQILTISRHVGADGTVHHTTVMVG